MNLKTKIFRIIPIWLIIVLALSGTAIAAVTLISNSLQTTVTVTKTPVTLSGTIVQNRYAGIQYGEEISYTVNNVPAQGYILLTFSRAPMQPGATSLSDVTVESNGMAWSNNLLAGDYLYCLSGYPKLVGSEIQYLIGVPATVAGQPSSPPGITPFNFGAGGATSGILHWWVTYNTDVSMVVRVQVTSTLP